MIIIANSFQKLEVILLMNQPRRHQKVGDVFSRKSWYRALRMLRWLMLCSLMHVHNVTAIFVKHEQSIVGIWTEADCLQVDITSPVFKDGGDSRGDVGASCFCAKSVLAE